MPAQLLHVLTKAKYVVKKLRPQKFGACADDHFTKHFAFDKMCHSDGGINLMRLGDVFFWCSDTQPNSHQNSKYNGRTSLTDCHLC